MPIEFRAMGFEPAYEVEVSPDSPPVGGWRLQEVHHGSSPAAENLVIRVNPLTGAGWIGHFESDREGPPAGLYACPGAEHLLVVTGTRGFLCRSDDPAAGRPLPVTDITGVEHPDSTNLLLITSATGLAALDADGLLWASPSLFSDGLTLLPGRSGSISVRGTIDGAPGVVLALELDTGHVIQSD